MPEISKQNIDEISEEVRGIFEEADRLPAGYKKGSLKDQEVISRGKDIAKNVSGDPVMVYRPQNPK